MTKFKNGDRVRMIMSHDNLDPKIGVGMVKGHQDGPADYYGYAIEFDSIGKSNRTLHNCDGLCMRGMGWWVPGYKLELATKPIFKIGDQVIRSNGWNPEDVGTVNGVFANDHYGVMWSSGYGSSNSWTGKELTLITPEPIVRTVKKPAIVAKIINGSPQPSTRPFVHADFEAAAKEAVRLAEANPGTEFAVYERVTARIADRPTARVI